MKGFIAFFFLGLCCLFALLQGDHWLNDVWLARHPGMQPTIWTNWMMGILAACCFATAALLAPSKKRQPVRRPTRVEPDYENVRVFDPEFTRDPR